MFEKITPASLSGSNSLSTKEKRREEKRREEKRREGPFFDLEDESITVLGNVCNALPVYTA
jgi:hypothetical protein